MSSVPPATDLLLEIRDRTDESCPFSFTLLGLLALADGVLGIAAAGGGVGRGADHGNGHGAAPGGAEVATRDDAFETRDENAARVVADAGLTLALGAVALSQRLLAACAAASRPERGEPAPARPSGSFASAEEDPWCDALV